MKRFAFGLPRVWVALLALLLVGFLCAPFSVLAATSIDVSSVTNRYFIDYDDFDAFRQGQIADVDQLLLDAYALSNEVSSARSSSLAAMMRAQSAWNQVQLHQSAQGDSGFLRLATNYLNQSISDSEAAIDSCDRSLDDVDGIITDLRAMKTSLQDASMPTYQIVVQAGGGGGCSCPDYTAILEQISVRLLSISNTLSTIKDYLLDLYYSVPNFILGFEEGSTGSTDWSDLTNSGIEGGRFLGTVVSNAWDYAYYANLYPDIGNGIFDVNGVRTGPRFLQEMWNYILRPFAQTWSDYEWDQDNRMIHGFRDFYIGQHYVVPTNVISNPLWVQFTNSVTLSPSTLAALTNYTPLVNQFMDRLTNSVLTVTILQSSYDEQLETEKEKTEEAAEEASDDASDPDADSVELPTVDISRVSSVGTSVSRVFTSYAEMFDSIPNELPDYVMLHEGWNLGPIEIQSMYWNLHDSNSITNMLTLLRGLFSSLWFVLYVVVVWSAMAIDLFCAGVCIYSVYGLLLGKPETTVKGIRHMFNLLCSLLGRDPPGK